MAVDAAMRARPMFERMLYDADPEDFTVESIIVIKPAKRGGKMAVHLLHRKFTLMEVFEDMENEASIVIDAVAIASHVTSELSALDLPPVILTGNETRSFIFGRLAKVLLRPEIRRPVRQKRSNRK